MKDTKLPNTYYIPQNKLTDNTNSYFKLVEERREFIMPTLDKISNELNNLLPETKFITNKGLFFKKDPKEDAFLLKDRFINKEKVTATTLLIVCCSVNYVKIKCILHVRDKDSSSFVTYSKKQNNKRFNVILKGWFCLLNKN